jgi:hypothetical protein
MTANNPFQFYSQSGDDLLFSCQRECCHGVHLILSYHLLCLLYVHCYLVTSGFKSTRPLIPGRLSQPNLHYRLFYSTLLFPARLLTFHPGPTPLYRPLPPPNSRATHLAHSQLCQKSAGDLKRTRPRPRSRPLSPLSKSPARPR